MFRFKRHGQYGLILFLLCWISYFSTYIGRQNYSAVMAEIIQAEGYLNRTCGLVGTGFFICYGLGQVFSGFLGDRWNPKWMIFIGIAISAIVNGVMAFLQSPEAMVAVWCLNGAAQSMTWSPILRIFSEYLPEDQQKSACVNIATTYPAAVFLTYPLCSLIVYQLGWRSVFTFTAAFMGIVAAVWIIGFSWVERAAVGSRAATSPSPVRSAIGPSSLKPHPEHDTSGFSFTPAIVLMLALIGGSLMVQGALRDGITNWVPSYLSNTYQVGTFIAIFATTFLPFINLFGVYAANFVYRKWKKNELETSLILFLAAFVFLVCLVLTEGVHLFLSLLFFSLTTSCMMGVNMMLVSFVPTNFIRWGRVSTISGLLNSTVYIGSSIATYGLGAVADLYGWPVLIRFLSVACLAGVVFCLLASPGWKRFLKS